MFTETGVVIALTHVLMPFMVISVWASLQRLDPQIENAAMSLGASPLDRAAPHRPAADRCPASCRARIIVFALAASAFATPAIIGGRRLKVAATLAYDEFLNTLNWPLGAAIAMLLLVAQRRHHRRLQPPGRAALRRGVPMSRNGPLALAFHALFVVFMLAPILDRLRRRLHARGLSSRCRRTGCRCAGSGHRATIRIRRGLLDQPLARRAVVDASPSLFAVPAALAIARYRFPGREAMHGACSCRR